MSEIGRQRQFAVQIPANVCIRQISTQRRRSPPAALVLADARGKFTTIDRHSKSLERLMHRCLLSSLRRVRSLHVNQLPKEFCGEIIHLRSIPCSAGIRESIG